MKRILALVLSLAMLLTGCANPQPASSATVGDTTTEAPADEVVLENIEPQFDALDDADQGKSGKKRQNGSDHTVEADLEFFSVYLFVRRLKLLAVMVIGDGEREIVFVIRVVRFSEEGQLLNEPSKKSMQ